MAISLVGTTADKKTMIDYTDALKSAELTTSRLDSPAKLTFEGVETEGIAMPEATAMTPITATASSRVKPSFFFNFFTVSFNIFFKLLPPNRTRQSLE